MWLPQTNQAHEAPPARSQAIRAGAKAKLDEGPLQPRLFWEEILLGQPVCKGVAISERPRPRWQGMVPGILREQFEKAFAQRPG